MYGSWGFAPGENSFMGVFLRPLYYVAIMYYVRSRHRQLHDHAARKLGILCNNEE
jgi:hypothetical protein